MHQVRGPVWGPVWGPVSPFSHGIDTEGNGADARFPATTAICWMWKYTFEGLQPGGHRFDPGTLHRANGTSDSHARCGALREPGSSSSDRDIRAASPPQRVAVDSRNH